MEQIISSSDTVLFTLESQDKIRKRAITINNVEINDGETPFSKMHAQSRSIMYRGEIYVFSSFIRIKVLLLSCLNLQHHKTYQSPYF